MEPKTGARFTAFDIIVLVLILVIAAGLVVTGVFKVNDASDRISCANNLEQMGLALLNYHDTAGRFPAGTMANAGLPPEQRLSWLVAILPYVESSPLYSRIDTAKCWDSAANRAVITPPYKVYLCPNSPRGAASGAPAVTTYVGSAGVGGNAALLPASDLRAGVFGYDREVRRASIKDGPEKTLAVIETALDNGPWATGGPATVRGLDPDREPYLGRGQQFGGQHLGVTNALFADGSVHGLSNGLDAHLLKALATIRGGEDLTGEDY
ncbi:MAG TPA: DUF1559 domain-containing protein [Gemmataceae bacterium]|nr:DUF1559 domain-containing protein [Gemmataceae bacterium]